MKRQGVTDSSRTPWKVTSPGAGLGHFGTFPECLLYVVHCAGHSDTIENKRAKVLALTEPVIRRGIFGAQPFPAEPGSQWEGGRGSSLFLRIQPPCLKHLSFLQVLWGIQTWAEPRPGLKGLTSHSNRPGKKLIQGPGSSNRDTASQNREEA